MTNRIAHTVERLVDAYPDIHFRIPLSLDGFPEDHDRIRRRGSFEKIERTAERLVDIRGRVGIIEVHSRKIPLAPDVDITTIARGTPGFSGADIANLCNEAALIAARKERARVIHDDFESAKDKVMLGSERRSLILSDEETRNTAYHEAGHALVAHMLPEADPLHKVTIIPRGMALGVTMQLPIDDRHTYTREYILASIAVALGGRAAEELCLGRLTTGAGSDLVRTTALARKMVCEYGMSDELGPLTFGKKDEQLFLGRDFQQVKEYSEATAVKIDEQMQKLVSDQYALTQRILKENRPVLVSVAAALLEREVLNGDEIAALARGEELPAPGAKAAADNGESAETESDVSETEPRSDEPGGRSPLTGPVEQPG